MELEAIKICGLSTPQDLEAVIVGGATHMGLIFFEKSPRHVDLETAEALSKIAKGRVKRVAVSVNASAEYLDEIVTRVQPDMLQLHGSESPEWMAELKAKYGLPLIKALAIHEVNDLEKIAPYSDVEICFCLMPSRQRGQICQGVMVSHLIGKLWTNCPLANLSPSAAWHQTKTDQQRLNKVQFFPDH